MLEGGATSPEMSFSPHVISSVKHESAAYGLLQIGDEVAAVNGQNIVTMHPSSVQQLFAKYASGSIKESMNLSVIRRDKGDNWGITSRKLEISINIAGGGGHTLTNNQQASGMSTNGVFTNPAERGVHNTSQNPHTQFSRKDGEQAGTPRHAAEHKPQDRDLSQTAAPNAHNQERDMYSSNRSVTSNKVMSSGRGADAHSRTTPRNGNGNGPDMFSSTHIATFSNVTNSGIPTASYTDHGYKESSRPGTGLDGHASNRSNREDGSLQRMPHDLHGSYRGMQDGGPSSRSARDTDYAVRDARDSITPHSDNTVRATYEANSSHRISQDTKSNIPSTYDASRTAHSSSSTALTHGSTHNASGILKSSRGEITVPPRKTIYVPNKFREEGQDKMYVPSKLREENEMWRSRTSSSSSVRSQVCSMYIVAKREVIITYAAI
jgi:hypothetical protein